MEIELDNKAIIDDFSEFEKNSRKRWSPLFDKIKEIRNYVAGEQYEQSDKDLLGDNRVARKLNIVSNTVRTVVNSYMPHMYGWETNNPELTEAGNNFLSDSENKTASVEALRNSTESGLGIMVISEDIDVDGSVKPVLYAVSDVTNVLLDPNISKLNGSDQEKCAIIDLKSKKHLENLYGIMLDDEEPLVNISTHYDKKNYIPLVTYYVKEDGLIRVYTLLKDQVVDYHELNMTYIPVIPVFGELCFDKDSKVTYRGVVEQMKEIQRLVNYCYNQEVERLALSPKFTWVGSIEATEGFQNDYKDSGKRLNQFLGYNQFSDDGQTKLDRPELVRQEVNYADIAGLMESSLNMVNSIVGIPTIGLETNVEKSATEILQNEKIFNNNIRVYIEHLKYSLQVVGMCYFEILMHQKLFGQIKVDVVAGPDEALKKQEARIALTNFAPFLTSDEDKRKLVIAQAAIEEDNKWIKNFAMSLNPVPTNAELQANQMVDQANIEIKNRDAQIMELQKRINELEIQSKLNSYSTEQQILLKDRDFEHQKELKILDAQLAANNPGEQAKIEADIYKANAQIEKTAMDIEKEKVKQYNGWGM